MNDDTILILEIMVFVFGVLLFASALIGQDKKEAGVCACRNCGSITKAQRIVPGSTLTEILLLLLFVVPGIFYKLIRQANAKKVCSVCGSTEIMPPNSVRGKEIQAEFSRSA